LRRLRELYPDVRIKLFYARDFKALLLKYGRIDLAASLSGEEGQARPAEATPLVDATSTEASGSTDLTPPDAAAASALGAMTETAAAPPGTEAAGSVRHRRSRRARRRRRAAVA
jgi:hypothetical protein